MKTITLFSTKTGLWLFTIIVTYILTSCIPDKDFYEDSGILDNKRQDTIMFSTDKKIINSSPTAIELGFYNYRYNYKLGPNTHDRLFFSTNTDLTYDDINFDTLVIITKADTISLYGKITIFSKFKKESKYFSRYEIK